MDLDSIIQKLNTWLENFVEQPHPALGGWSPCPYARQARITGQIKILAGSQPWADAVAAVGHGLWQREVVIYCYDQDAIAGSEFSATVKQINAALAAHGVFALDDHPDCAETVNGVSFNFGHCALMILQLTSKLDRAAASLAKKGYYDGWPDEYLQELFHGRQDPRA